MKSTLRMLLLVASVVPLSASALADLGASAPTGPERLFSGRTAEVTFAIDNTGDSAANGFTYRLYVSTNRVIVLRDPELQLQSAVVDDDCDPSTPPPDPQPAPGGPLNLPANTTVCVTAVGLVPEAVIAGEYYLGVIVDPTGVVEEENPSNNSVPGLDQLPLRTPAPDLTASEVRLPAKGAAGESIPVTFTLENRGNEPADFGYGVYLSLNDIISSEDVLLTELTHSMEGGVQETKTQYVPLAPGLPEGSYYIGVVVDPADTVAELDEYNNSRVSALPVEVTRPSLYLATSFVPEGTLGAEYVWRFAARGGTGQYAFQVIGGELPPGLELDGQLGELSGTPTETGEFTFILEVRSGGIAIASAYTVLVVSPTVSLTIQTSALPPAELADDYQTRLVAVGGIAPYEWSVSPDALPNGMELAADGMLSGAPRSSGDFELDLRVQDARGTIAQRTMSLRVIDRGALTISTGFLPVGEAGAAYIAGFETVGGKEPITWALVSGRLPTGLALDASTAILQGTPTEVGRFTFQMQARDANGLFDTNSYTIEVVSQPLAIVTNEFEPAQVGEAYAQNLNVLPSSGEAPFVWSIASGSLPGGLDFLPEGEITGTPAEGSAGLYTVLMRVVDQRGAVGYRSYLLKVTDPALALDNSFQPEPKGGCATGTGAAGSLGLLLVAAALLLRRRRGALLAALVALAPPTAASAQNYSVQQVDEAFAPVSGGSPINFSSNDDARTTLSLPFDVRFYDQTFSSIGVTTNGLVVMGTAASAYSGNDSIPDSSTPNGGLIAAWWDDLEKGSGSTAIWKTVGTAPHRVFILQFLDWQRLNGSQQFDFQIRFFEGESSIKVNYGPITSGSDSFTATVGIENPAGDDGVVGLGCNGNCAGAAWPAGKALTYTTLPDLIAYDARAPSVVYGSIPVQVSATVENIGGEAAGPFQVVAVLSADKVHDSGDVVLNGKAQVPGLGLGVKADISFVATTPDSVVADRNYYLFIVPNRSGQLDEVTTVNNASNPAPVRTGPPTPNFKAAAPQTGTDNNTVAPGGSLSVTFNIHNTGNLAGQTDYRIVLSSNQVISPEDLTLLSGSVSVDALSVETFTKTVPFPSDLAAASYYLGLLVDPENLINEPNEADNAAAGQSAIAVASGEVVALTPDLPAGIVGQPYLALLEAGGGDGTYTWTLATGSLPPGLELDRSGVLSGIPEAAGDFHGQLMVRSAGGVALPGFDLTISDPTQPLTVVSGRLPDGVFGAEYVGQLIAAGGEPPYEWQLVGGELPPGLVLAPSGIISGLPHGDGEYTFSVSVSDQAEAVAEQDLAVYVAQPGNVVVVTMHLPAARLGEDYELDLEAAGGEPPYKWGIQSPGRLPDGLELSEAGLISGTPTEVGSFDLVVQVRDQKYQIDTNTLSLTVGYDQGITIATEHLPPATLEEAYEATLHAVGGRAPYRWTLVEGSLPPGLSLAPEGVISGTPTGTPEESVQVFAVEVTDATGRRDMRGLALFLGPAPATPAIEGDGCSTASGSGGAFGLLLVLGAALFGLRRKVRVRGPVVAAGLVGLVVGFASMTACGPNNPCTDVACPAGSVCSLGDGQCHCGGPGGDVCAEDETCDPVAFACMPANFACEAVQCTHGMRCDPGTGECACGTEVCSGDQVCDWFTGRCEDADKCEGVVCAAGEACNPTSGLCQCGESACTLGETCVDGVCEADPCYGVACTGGNACDPTDGACKCGGEGGMTCNVSQVCDPDTGACLAAASCVGVTCRAGLSCDPSDGQCKCGGLGGEVCHDDQVCDLSTYECTGGDPCTNVTCTAGTSCDPEDGLCKCGGLGGALCETGELCITLEETGAFCTPSCTPAYETTGCGEGEGCYYSPVVDETFCYSEGPVPVDSFCGSTEDCISGHHCMEAGAFDRCMPYCDPSVSPPADGSCPQGTECDATLFAGKPDLGVCVYFGE